MKPLFRTAFVLAALVLFAGTAHAQARVVIKNQSSRQMTVKVMRALDDGDTLHRTTSIAPYGTQTVDFSYSGTYFLKTMAVASGRDPVFQKGQKFTVYNGAGGYTVITMTFSIVESASPQIAGGQGITRQEFDRDSTSR